MERMTSLMDNQWLSIIITLLFLISVFAMFLLHDKVRKNRVLYRLGYSFVALSGMAGSLLLVRTTDDASVDSTEKIIFTVFVLIVGIPILIYNARLLIRGEGEVLTSTLKDCTVRMIVGGRFKQRVSYRVEGTSVEGNKDSFLLKYPPDKEAVTKAPVTENTRIVVQYYSESYSIIRVTREDDEESG